jgi:hypothetical protein
MPSYIQAIGRTPHVVGVCVNRIGKAYTATALLTDGDTTAITANVCVVNLGYA